MQIRTSMRTRARASARDIDCAALSKPSLQRRLIELAQQPYAPLWIVLASLLLLAPCLGVRLLMDDYVLALKALPETRIAAFPATWLSLFTFTTGDPQQNVALMDEGALLPWWTDPRHLNAFFRPLSSLTHQLDFRLWPSSTPAMHLHSLLWYALLLAALLHVYRAFAPASPFVVVLGLFIYAVDDAHGPTVAWIANRNAIVSAALALPALSTHHRAVRTNQSALHWLAALWLALGLCAGETALCMFGYLGAYVVCLDRRSIAARAWSVAPYLVPLIAHRVVYHLLHLGSFGSGAYHDPLREPLAFASTLAFNLPVLLSAQLFLPVADAAFWGEVRGLPWLWLWSASSLSALAWLFAPLLRRDTLARFWALGMVASAVPVSASLPGERLLIPVGIGAAALLAHLFAAAWSLDERGASSQATAPSGGARESLLKALVVLHLVVAPCALPVRAYSFEPLARAIDRADAAVPRDPSVASQTLVVLNTPLNILLSYVQIARALRSEPRPAHLLWLSSASSQTEVERVGPRALRVSQREGFLRRPEETHYRADVSELAQGARLTRAGVHLEVLESMSDGRPRSVLFEFDEPLESNSYVFRSCRDGQLVPWTPTPIGERVHFPAHDFFKWLALEVLR